MTTLCSSCIATRYTLYNMMAAMSDSTWDMGSPLPVPMALPQGAGESLDGCTGELEPAGGLVAAGLAWGAAWPEERSGAAV